MNNTLKPVNFLSEFSQSSVTGLLEITRNSVVWKLFFMDGKLESATHSLQSKDTLKYYLQSLGYDQVNKTDWFNEKNNNYSPLIKEVIHQLENRGYLNSKQKATLVKKITEDALESLFWVSQDVLIDSKEIQPFSLAEKQTLKQNQLLEIPHLIETISKRTAIWQKQRHFIASPHQRPYCANPSLLEKSPSLGNLSIGILKQLVKLMQGLSIRELAFLIKQDELKLAQLLSSYIKHEILQLHPPKPPLNLLPEIPLPPQEFPLNQFKIGDKKTNKLTGNTKKYTIICIDDSPTMLDLVGSYLDDEQYDLITIEDPMKSLSYLFKSNPDLILMDISMPGIKGNRLCNILKSSSVFKNVPIILISGDTKVLNQETLQSTGAIDYLPKPFTKDDLLTIIEKYC